MPKIVPAATSTGVCPNDAQTILIDPMGFVKLIQQLINPNGLKAD